MILSRDHWQTLLALCGTERDPHRGLAKEWRWAAVRSPVSSHGLLTGHVCGVFSMVFPIERALCFSAVGCLLLAQSAAEI